LISLAKYARDTASQKPLLDYSTYVLFRKRFLENSEYFKISHLPPVVLIIKHITSALETMIDEYLNEEISGENNLKERMPEICQSMAKKRRPAASFNDYGDIFNQRVVSTPLHRQG
jgi:hypothetical protein